MTITYQESTVGTMHCERLEEEGLYNLITPNAKPHEIDTVLQAHRMRDPVTFTASPKSKRQAYDERSLRAQKEGYVYQIGRRGHWLETFIIVPEEYHG